MKNVMGIGILGVVLVVAAGALAAGDGDVEIRLNGGDNFAYIGETNTVEVWVKNDATLNEMTLGFQCRVELDHEYLSGGYSNGYWRFPDEVVADYEGDIAQLFGCCGGSNDAEPPVHGFSIDATVPGFEPHQTHTLVAWLEIDISADQEETPYGFVVDNVSLQWPTSQPGWEFVDDLEGYPPTYHGLTNNTTQDASAAGRIFHIIHRDRGECCAGKVGDVNANGAEVPTIGDLTALIDHLFGARTGLFCAAEADFNQSGGDISIGDVTVLIDHLFGSQQPLPDCP